MFTSSSMVSNCGTHLKLSSQDQRRGHLHSYNVYLLLVYLTIVISPGPFDKEDEEEGIKEERGDAPTGMCQSSLPDSRHTRSHRCAASSAAASRVDTMSDHCVVSAVTLCYALPQ